MLKVIVFFCLVALSCALLDNVGTDDEEVLEAANEAAKAISKQFSGHYHHRLHRVLKARKQPSLGGATFFMDIVVGQTTCKKDEVSFEEASDCEFATGRSIYKKCITTVFKDSNGSLKVGQKGCILATKKEIEG